MALKSLVKMLLQWSLLIVGLPLLIVAAIITVRYFYGPVFLEIRNGSGRTVSIERVSIKRCAGCEAEMLEQPPLKLDLGQRDYFSFNAKRGPLLLEITLTKTAQAESRQLNCTVLIVATACD